VFIGTVELDDLRNIVNDKLRQNANIRTEMLSLIDSGEAIAFVGAGLGVPLEYPSWPDLLNELNAEAQKLEAFTISAEIGEDYLKRADAIKEHFRSHESIHLYQQLLGRRFGPRASGCTETHKLLAGLPFRGFATTNYEPAVEIALQSASTVVCPDHGIIVKMDGKDRHLVSTFLRSLTDGNIGPRFVAHLHGRYTDTENIILTEKDYEVAYGLVGPTDATPRTKEVTLHRQLAWALFATRRIVFVGCSMYDPYIRALLDAVARDLWETLEKSHFVILPIGSGDVESAESVMAKFGRYGLRVVYYDNLDGKHTGLDQLLNEAAARCSASRKALPTAKATASPVSTAGPAAGGIPPGTSVSADWLDEVNERNAPKSEPD